MMKPPYYFVLDITNNGVLCGTWDRALAVTVSAGIIDTLVRTIPPGNPQYDMVAQITQDCIEGRLWCLDKKIWLLALMRDEQMNTTYEHKRAIASLRLPIIEYVHTKLQTVTTKPDGTPWYGIESIIQKALDTSYPDEGEYALAITEYASINEMSPYEAYRELKIKCETSHLKKMRAYSWMQRMMKMVRSVNDAESAEKVMEFFQNKFNKDGSL